MNDLTRKLRAAADWCDQHPSKNVYSVLLCGEDDGFNSHSSACGGLTKNTQEREERTS